MSEPVKVYEARVSGLWNTRHEIFDGEKPKGSMTTERNALGTVTRCLFRPVKGSPLEIRREPGLLRGQFSMWAVDTHEWLGTTVRFAFFKREIEVSTGGRPYTLHASPGFGRGWTLNAPKQGLVARITPKPFARSTRIEVYRRLDFLMVMMAYTVASQIYPESWFPGPADRTANSGKTVRAET